MFVKNFNSIKQQTVSVNDKVKNMINAVLDSVMKDK